MPTSTSTPWQPARTTRSAAAAKLPTISSIIATVISRGMMWNRSSGSADGATATSRLPSSEFMRARPSWYSWPKKRQSWASQSSTMRRSGSMQSSVAAQPFG